MRRNKNIFKGSIVLSNFLANWLENQPAVGARITDIQPNSFKFELGDQIITVINDQDQLDNMSYCIEDEDIFEKLHDSLTIGQSLRIGSGQWTFFSEPEELRLIIGERTVVDMGTIEVK